VIITPVGPGHEALAREAQASVEAAFRSNPGPFTDVICLTLDDTKAEHGRSRRRNDGIAWALANGYDWIFFLDADDLMASDAFAAVAPHISTADAVFGLIVEQTDGEPRVRPGQLGATTHLIDIVRNDPYLTLQMGHFVRAQAASAIGFDADMDTGEDFKYYLELWRRFRCCKIDRALFINRRGRHSEGPRSADGKAWRESLSRVFGQFCALHNIQIAFRHEGKEARFAFDNPMEPVQAQIARGRFFDSGELDYLRTLLPQKPVVVDIAPNVGNHMVYFGLHMASPRIIALAASAGEAAILKRNVGMNGLDSVVDLSGLDSPVTDLASRLKNGADLIRIGESAGLAALQDATNLIEAARPVLFISLHSHEVDGLLLWAGEHGYCIVRSASRRGVQSHVLVAAGHSALPAPCTMPGLKAFVVTLLELPQSVEVATRCVESARRQGIDAEMFPATDKASSRSELQRLGLSVQQHDQTFSNTDAAMGLFATSFRIWQKIADELEYGLVMEHDAVVTAAIPDLRGKGDIINLGKPSYGDYNLKAAPGVYGLFSKNAHPQYGIYMPGAHAYFLTKAGARQLISRALESGAAPCDVFLNTATFPNIKEIYPWVAVAADSFSTIQKQRGCVAKHNFGGQYRILNEEESGDAHATAGRPAPTRIAVVTPYFKESRELLERCIASVRNQTLAVEHIVVADGHAQDWLDGAGVRHIRLDRSHADYGNTPRSIGGQLAAAEGFQAIAFLDADNWFVAEHRATCAELLGRAQADFISAQRHWVRIDGSRMAVQVAEDDDGSHVDTNCFFLGTGAFHSIPRWGLMPKPMAMWCDRFYLASLRQEGLREARTDRRTVNYLCTWKNMFQSIGEEPPYYAKDGVPIERMQTWLRSLQPADLAQVQRLSGCDLAEFFRERNLRRAAPQANPRVISGAGAPALRTAPSLEPIKWASR
jgi:glycosyltransferase involved in cell wall biosynthesis